MVSHSDGSRRRKLLVAVGVALLATWTVWWGFALARSALPFLERTWMKNPAFGADFWSQSDYAARLWRAGLDPYENERHLFHYPPIVIRMFLWTPFFGVVTALRIWIVVLAILLGVACVYSWRTRTRLGLFPLPLVLVMGGVLLTTPALFTLERSNFDLVTLAAILLAVPLLEKEQPALEVLAGALLAFGPWVKIYPGLIGLALLALRRYRCLAGFVLGGVLIGIAMPTETLRSFEVLQIAIGRVKQGAHGVPFPPWSHSLSIAWSNVVDSTRGMPIGRLLQKIPGSVVAVLVLSAPLLWVCLRVYRCRRSAPLAFPLMLWVVSAASYVPDIANDYSLAFLPLAAVSVLGGRDSRAVVLGTAIAAIWWQPLAFPVPGLVLLVVKVVGLVVVGAGIVERAEELGTA
jgi:hypothetical protein